MKPIRNTNTGKVARRSRPAVPVPCSGEHLAGAECAPDGCEHVLPPAARELFRMLIEDTDAPSAVMVDCYSRWLILAVQTAVDDGDMAGILEHYKAVRARVREKLELYQREKELEVEGLAAEKALEALFSKGAADFDERAKVRTRSPAAKELRDRIGGRQ